MEQWSVVFSVTGGSAATLLGLLFVAVSIHAGASGGMHQNSRLLAEQVFQNYLVVVLVSLLALFPTLKLTELGNSTLALTAARAILALVRMYHATMQPFGKASRLESLRRQLASLAGFGLLIYSAFGMARGEGDPRTLFAVAILILLAAATTGAWELLMRISAKQG